MTAATANPLTKTLVPVLQPLDWRGRKVCLHRPLVSGDAPGLLVGFGSDAARSVSYLVREVARQGGIGVRDAERHAVRNLRRRPERAPWQPNLVPWRGSETTVLLRAGDDLTASDVVDRRLLAEAHEHLEADVIYVAVPSRFSMVAADSPEPLFSLAEELRETAEEEGSGPLSAAVFRVEKGRPTAIASRRRPRRRGRRPLARRDDRPVRNVPGRGRRAWRAPARSARLPGVAVAAAVLDIALGVLCALVAVLFLGLATIFAQADPGVSAGASAGAGAAVGGLFGLLGVVWGVAAPAFVAVGVGLLRRRAWAFSGQLLLSGLFVAIGLLITIASGPSVSGLLGIALYATPALLILGRPVRAALR